MDFIQSLLLRFLKPTTVDTILLRIFCLINIPLIYYLKPHVVEAGPNRCIIKIPLNRRSKNHVRSMYFGSLSVGADLTGGFMAMKAIEKTNRRIKFVFKNFHADFTKRAHGDVFFISEEGANILKTVQECNEKKERTEVPFYVKAYTLNEQGERIDVATFTLTLSVK